MIIRCVLAMILFCGTSLANGLSLDTERRLNLGMYIMMSNYIEAIDLSSCGELIDVAGSINDEERKIIINKFKPENRKQINSMFDYEESRYAKDIEAKVESDFKNRAGGRTESCERIMKYYAAKKSLYHKNIFD